MTARDAADGLRDALVALLDTSIADNATHNAVDCAEQAIHAALAVLDAQAEREAGARDELARVRALIDNDRTGLAAGLNAVRTTLNGWDWLGGDTWGSYSYEDHTVAVLRREIASCLSEAQAHIAKALRESGDRADSAFHPERAVQREVELLRQVEEARGIALRLRTGHLLKQQMVADNAVIEGWSK